MRRRRVLALPAAVLLLAGEAKFGSREDVPIQLSSIPNGDRPSGRNRTLAGAMKAVIAEVKPGAQALHGQRSRHGWFATQDRGHRQAHRASSPVAYQLVASGTCASNGLETWGAHVSKHPPRNGLDVVTCFVLVCHSMQMDA